MKFMTEPPPDPGSPQKRYSPVATRLLSRARNEWKQQRLEAAGRSLTSVLALVPGDPVATRMLGIVTQRRGDHAGAVDCFRQVLAVWPEDADLQLLLGISLYERGHADEAVTHFRRACELAPTSAPAWFNLGKVLGLEAHHGEAVEALSRALALAPSHRSARLLLAKAQASLGRIDTASKGFREVLRQDPGNAEAWFGLSSLNTTVFDTGDTALLRRALARTSLSPREYELLHFTLAKALESEGDYAQAFEAFRHANASRRKRRARWNAAREHERVETIRRVFADGTPPPIAPRLGHEVILIVSMPRSGSTLVEQILASHPGVEGAHEIGDMSHVVDAENRRRHTAFPAWVPTATAQDWQRLGNQYLARTARWRKTKPRFTDKNLLNWPLVGAALAMLPAARVVVVRRDPVETCLGCYRQGFSEVHGFACDLDETADYCIDFLRLTRFWLNTYPASVFDLRYETLIADPETTIRRLLDFCDLPFDPACLAFHETSRTALDGPSAAQVRQPLRRDTARSARYGDKLAPLRQRLRDAGILAK